MANKKYISYCVDYLTITFDVLTVQEVITQILKLDYNNFTITEGRMKYTDYDTKYVFGHITLFGYTLKKYRNSKKYRGCYLQLTGEGCREYNELNSLHNLLVECDKLPKVVIKKYNLKEFINYIKKCNFEKFIKLLKENGKSALTKLINQYGNNLFDEIFTEKGSEQFIKMLQALEFEFGVEKVIELFEAFEQGSNLENFIDEFERLEEEYKIGFYQKQWHATRIDLAIDDKNAVPYCTPKKIHKKCNKNEFIFTGKGLRVNESRYEDAVGTTVYFGSEKSNFQIRIYDKDVEYAKKNKKPLSEVESWKRTEIQLRCEEADEVANRLCKMDKPEKLGEFISSLLRIHLRFVTSKNKTCDWWNRFIGDVEQIDFKMPKSISSLKNKENWLLKKVGLYQRYRFGCF